MSEYSHTFDEVRRAAEQAVRAEGHDYVYESPEGVCLYSHGDEPGCIVGHIFRNLSTDLFAALREAERKMYTDGEPSSFTVGGIQTYVPVRFSPATMAFLSNLQAEQDDRAEWGRALKEAERTHLSFVYEGAHEENYERDELKAESDLQ